MKKEILQSYEEAHHNLFANLGDDDHLIVLAKLDKYLISSVYGNTGDVATLLLHKMLESNEFAETVLSVAALFVARKRELRKIAGIRP